MNNRKLIMVCGPYRAESVWEITQNIIKARSIAAQLWSEGWDVFCPHANTAHFDGICEDDVWLNFTCRMLTYCDAVYMMENWENSEGSQREYELASKLNKEIIYQNGG